MKEYQPLPESVPWRIFLGMIVSLLFPLGSIAQYQVITLPPPIESSLENAVFDTPAQIMDVAVSGTVTDQNGKPLPGVTIIVEGSSAGTVTDLAGKYNLEVPEGSSLVFSFVGYRSETRLVGDQSIINIILREDLTA